MASGWLVIPLGPTPHRLLDRVPSVQVRPAGRPGCARHHPGPAPSDERLAGRHAVHCHHPCRVANCRACKSGQLDDTPVPAAAQAGGRVPSVLVRPAERPTVPRHCPALSTDCRACETSQPDDLPLPSTAQTVRRVPSDRLVYLPGLPPPRPLDRVPIVQARLAGRPACARHRPGRVPSPERPAGLPAMHHHHPGQVPSAKR